MNYNLFHAINQFAGKSDWLDDIMEFCAQDIVWLIVAILAGLWITAKKSNQRMVFYAALSCVVSLAIAALLISPEVNHPRPFVGHHVTQLIPHAADPSFPSDHSTFAFSIAFSVWFVRRRLGSVLLGLAVLTGFSRVYVGVHYPADIIGSAALGLIVSYLVNRMNGKLDVIPNGLIHIYNSITRKLKFLPHSSNG